MGAVAEQVSPNYDERDPKVPLQYIVLHYTGMISADAALKRMCDPQAKVSAHYMIDEGGKVFWLVAEKNRAWHAGKSSWRGVSDVNSASIGIELVNPGHEHGYRAFPAAQIEALKKLLHEIVQRHGMNPLQALLAHSDVAPARKEDPGELFPWEELAREGVGIWPQVQESDYAPIKDGEVQNLLRALGYDCSELRKAVTAFQRRFLPQNLSGMPKKETVAWLRALVRRLGDVA
jgi:N-acetylmuramoyl-L-alanine amidase